MLFRNFLYILFMLFIVMFGGYVCMMLLCCVSAVSVLHELACICAAILVLWQYVLYIGSRHGNRSLLHGMFAPHQSL